jgi:hypothetical protein
MPGVVEKGRTRLLTGIMLALHLPVVRVQRAVMVATDVVQLRVWGLQVI